MTRLGCSVATVLLLWPLAAAASAQVAEQANPPAGMLGLPRETGQVEAWAGGLFERLDADQDGAITGGELIVLSRGEIAARGGSRIRALVARSDASNDARVSREELLSGAARMFSRIDADGDGRLSDAEMPAPAAPRRSPAIPMPSAEPMPMPGMEDED